MAKQDNEQLNNLIRRLFLLIGLKHDYLTREAKRNDPQMKKATGAILEGSFLMYPDPEVINILRRTPPWDDISEERSTT